MAVSLEEERRLGEWRELTGGPGRVGEQLLGTQACKEPQSLLRAGYWCFIDPRRGNLAQGPQLRAGGRTHIVKAGWRLRKQVER